MDFDNLTPRNTPDEELLPKITSLEDKYRLFAENSYDMERWILPDKTLAYISPSCERVTGYSREEFMTNPDLLGDIVHPDDNAWFKAEREIAFARNSTYHMDLRIITKTGEIRWISIVTQRVTDKDGTDLGIRSSSRDVTDFFEIKNELKLSESRLKAVVESQSELIVRQNTENVILFVNDAAARFYDYKKEDAIGLKWLNLAPPEMADSFERLVNKLSREHPSICIDMLHHRFDGEKRWLSWISTGIFDEQGNLLEIQMVGRDITSRKETETRLQKALEEIQNLKIRLEQENIYLRETFLPSKAPDGIITDSPLMLDVLEKVKQVALTDSPVLVYGETGTGKELIAQAIHNAGSRRRRVMITVNCAALPLSLIESELFGRERGAYTGALTSQIGRFELADKSTIFLDEIGELPLEIQVKLLRVIQFGEFQMLGSTVTKKVDVRIIAATNKDLTKAQADGSFRNDLFYRLNVFPIKLPPLRDRKEDIPLLAWSFVDEIAGKSGKRIDKISTRSMNKLLKHSWPGNIRELRNVIEYSIILSQRPVLEIIMQETEPEHHRGDNLESEQRRHIEKILIQTGWRIRGVDGAAEKLGMKESTLRFRMKKLGIERKRN